MSKITRTFQLNNISESLVYEKSALILKNMNGQDIKEGNISDQGIKWISAIIPSIWGWGGMRLGISIRPMEENVQMIVEGYIAQLAGGPLKEVINSFIERISSQVSQKPVELKINSGQTKQSVSIIQSKDKQMVILVVLVTGIIPLIGIILLGRIVEPIIISAVLLGGYYFGNRLFYQQK